VCVCVLVYVAKHFPSLSHSVYPLWLSLDPSLSLFLSASFAFILFHWSQSFILSFVWCPLEKDDVMGDRRF